MSGPRAMLLVVLLYATCVAETSLGDAAAIGPIVPPVVPLVALIWVGTFRPPQAVLCGLLFGLASDLLGPGRVGPGAFWLVAAAQGAAWLREAWPAEHGLWRTGITAAALAAWAVLAGLTRWLLGEVPLPLAAIASRAALAGAYSGALSLPYWLLIGWAESAGSRQ